MAVHIYHEVLFDRNASPFFLAWGYTTSFTFLLYPAFSSLIIFRFSLHLLLILFSHRLLSRLLAFFPSLPPPPSLLPLSILLVPYHWADVLFCSPGGNVFLITACVSSYLQFFYQWPPHMPERRDGEGAAVRQLMLSAGGDFTTEFRGPVWPEEGQTGRV